MRGDTLSQGTEKRKRNPMKEFRGKCRSPKEKTSVLWKILADGLTSGGFSNGGKGSL